MEVSDETADGSGPRHQAGGLAEVTDWSTDRFATLVPKERELMRSTGMRSFESIRVLAKGTEQKHSLKQESHSTAFMLNASENNLLTLLFGYSIALCPSIISVRDASYQNCF
ncbi:unnamed protein product [Angiostrongylus costaricensis]|uniref:SAM domain-containing protein n=1 Tax=Angiostrongylus costaricensis TaxID=334426 RepID=A0A0R3PMJ9_ANGCS|nr:unnamed protein product [Angiostrongylus costaricensis]